MVPPLSSRVLRRVRLSQSQILRKSKSAKKEYVKTRRRALLEYAIPAAGTQSAEWMIGESIDGVHLRRLAFDNVLPMTLEREVLAALEKERHLV
jgi:hypothetical protein